MKQILFAKSWGTDEGKVHCVGTYEGKVQEIEGNISGAATALSFVDGLGHSIPFYKNGARVTVTPYEAGTQFGASIEFPETIVEGNEYTLIFIKKGVPFNERNKWTWSYLAKAGDTADTLEEDLIKFLENNVEGLGLTYEEGIGAANIGDDYTIIATDGFGYHKVGSDSPVKKTVGDKAYILDLMSKCAADSGFEYPSVETNTSKVYPGYGVITIDGAGDNKDHFDVVNVFFAEPREAAKPLDTAVNQIVHIVCPAGQGSGIKQQIDFIIDESGEF